MIRQISIALIVKAIPVYIVHLTVGIKSVQFYCYKMALIQTFEIIWVGVITRMGYKIMQLLGMNRRHFV